MAGKARTVAVPHRSALARVLRGRAYSKLIVALYRWRVGVGLLLRHQALHKLRQASQNHQQMITNLRKTAPRGSQRALQPLAHFSRISRILGLSCAIGQWKLFCAANATSAVPMTSSALSGNGIFTARARVKRASAQELALAEMRSECDSLRAEAVERERQLALVQKQLAAAVDRRRVVESDGRHAQELLARMQSEQGRVRAVRDGLVAAQEGEAEWRLEAARAFRERLIVVRELEHEERTAKWARELVLSCHGALLEAQRAQRRHASEMSAEKSRALLRMTEIQVAVAADVCTLAAYLRKQVADKALREQAKKRGALAALGTTITPATRLIAKCSVDSAKSMAKRSRFARENLSSGAATNTNPDEGNEITEEEGCGDHSECDEIPMQPTRAASAMCSAPVVRASAECGRDTIETEPRASLNATFRRDPWEPDQSKAALALVGVSETDLSESSANRQWLMQLRRTLTRRQLGLRRASALGTAWQTWINYCSAVINWEKLQAYGGQLEACRAEELRYKSLLVECRKKLAAEKNRADRLEASRSNEQLASRQLELQVTQLQQRLNMYHARKKAPPPTQPWQAEKWFKPSNSSPTSREPSHQLPPRAQEHTSHPSALAEAQWRSLQSDAGMRRTEKADSLEGQNIEDATDASDRLLNAFSHGSNTLSWDTQRVQDSSYVTSTLEVQCLASTNAFFDNSCESVGVSSRPSQEASSGVARAARLAAARARAARVLHESNS